MDDNLRGNIREVLIDEIGDEQYCPTCETYLRMVNVDCEGNYRRCLSCLGLFQRIFVPVKKYNRKNYRGLPTSEELLSYSKKVKELGKEE